MSRRNARRVTLVVVAGLMLGLVVAACGSDDGGGGGGGGKIAFLLPESKTARYEAQDRPLFKKKVKALCSDCEIIYSNADQDAAKQQQQAEAALTKGAKVLVLDPVDAASAGAIVTQAKQPKRPGHQLRPPDHGLADSTTTSQFDNAQGRQAPGRQPASTSSRRRQDERADRDDQRRADRQQRQAVQEGAHSVFDEQRLKIGKEYDTPDWSADKAQSEMEQAITALGKDGFDGVYAANDGTAGGAIAAMKAAGIKPSDRPTTGQDAELAGIQRILAGDQFMTVYKADQAGGRAARRSSPSRSPRARRRASLITGKDEQRQRRTSRRRSSTRSR